MGYILDDNPVNFEISGSFLAPIKNWSLAFFLKQLDTQPLQQPAKLRRSSWGGMTKNSLCKTVCD
jgi:hypothetical protein